MVTAFIVENVCDADWKVFVVQPSESENAGIEKIFIVKNEYDADRHVFIVKNRNDAY